MPPMTGPLVTRKSLADDLRAAGIVSGQALCVHISLSRLGFVVGGARTVIEALIDVVGPEGSIMMPTFSGELSDPAEWRYPPVPPEWIPIIREETPPYHPQLTPTRRMGVVAELFRHYPGVRRSSHPQSSFSAWGKHSGALLDSHPLNRRFGPDSPLAALVRIGGASLLLGAPLQTNTLLYLSTFGANCLKRVKKSAPMIVAGEPQWVSYEDVEYTNFWFSDAAAHLQAIGIATRFRIGAADCLLFPAAESIAATVRWRTEMGV